MAKAAPNCMTKLKEINGLQVYQAEGGCYIIKFPTQAGWRQGVVPNCSNIKSVGLPYRDRTKLNWFVDVNKQKIALS